MRIPQKTTRKERQALPLEKCLAKTWHSCRPKVSGCSEPPQSLAGRSVEEHCLIAHAVALRLLECMPHAQRILFPAYAARIPLVHDIGKVCPTFLEKIYRAIGHAKHSFEELQGVDPSTEKIWGGHSAVSYASLKDCTKSRPYVAEIAGAHHGKATASNLPDYVGYGGPTWHVQRLELIRRLLQKISGQEPDFDGPESPWPLVENYEQALLLKGFTSVSDWIASGSLFDNPNIPWQGLVDEAVERAGFQTLRIKKGLRFQDVFSFSPRPSQTAFYENIQQAGVYILEAPMGMGKTEAALYAAYCMMEKGLSSGLYFALPTQLTSNKIYERLNSFLGQILDNQEQKAVLVHGKAWLTRFAERMEMGADAAVNGSWFHGSKRGILAPFAVGTIDQALMAAMHVKYGAVRVYGLAGKTVILDEVHSYDTYTGTILDELVALLRHYGCTVIILSATLTAERRSALTGYCSEEQAYPLISASHAHGQCREIQSPPLSSNTVALQHPTEAQALEEAIVRAEDGQQVLWIENTVKKAQEMYALFASRCADLGIKTGLLHSRFTVHDRDHNEGYWTALYGKNAQQRSAMGRILVGTQVVEQSLDIDADFLVTRFCPTDMLLQRLGRLWRHKDTVRPKSARRETYLLHPTIDEVHASLSASHINTAKALWKESGFVYFPYVLFRSLERWGAMTEVRLPDDIRTLLEATYAQVVDETPLMCALYKELENARRDLRSLALSTLSTGDAVLSEERASTRVNQTVDVDVLLLRSLSRAERRLVLANGKVIQLPSSDAPWQEKQRISAELMLNIVRVAEHNAPQACSYKDVEIFSPYLYCKPNADGKVFLRIACITPTDTLCDSYSNPHEKVLCYREDYGYKTS
ncbi:MAG: CRISPR-associated helicase Cas3' [Pseudomonadota bacterium]